jgi:hypothetical protein
MLSWAALGAATVIAWCWAAGARDLLDPAILAWFVGGLVGVVWVVDGSARWPVVSGYVIGVVLAGVASKPLLSFLLGSSGQEFLVLSTLYLSAPLIGAAAGLACASSDPAVAFGFVRASDGMGKVRPSWRLIPWLAAPLLAVVIVGWRLLQGPVDSNGRPYGPGSKSCRTDSDCHVQTDCHHCGECYSESPNEPVDCLAICEPRPEHTCVCSNGFCASARRANFELQQTKAP